MTKAVQKMPQKKWGRGPEVKIVSPAGTRPKTRTLDCVKKSAENFRQSKVNPGSLRWSKTSLGLVEQEETQNRMEMVLVMTSGCPGALQGRGDVQGRCWCLELEQLWSSNYLSKSNNNKTRFVFRTS